MGSLAKIVAPPLAGGKESGSQDFLHMLMGSRAAGQAGYHPLAGLFGGMASLASGGQPQTGDSLQELFKKIGMSPIGSDPPGTPRWSPDSMPSAPMTNPGVMPTGQMQPPSAPLTSPNVGGSLEKMFSSGGGKRSPFEPSF